MSNTRPHLYLVKVGGKIVEDPAALNLLLSAFTALPGYKVLVHGGGRTATDVAAQLGIETKMVGGRRITDADMLRVVTMVYAGLVNKNVVAQLQGMGISAIGMTGADADVIRANRRPVGEVDYGFVGDVSRVDASRLSLLLRGGITPVLAPLTHDGAGQILNTNADTIAGEVAAALAEEFEVELLYVFEFPGVMQNPDDLTSVIPHINREKFTQLAADGVVAGGMLPKLENCLKAVERGVHQVRITRLEESTTTEIGTSKDCRLLRTSEHQNIRTSIGRFAPGTLITLS